MFNPFMSQKIRSGRYTPNILGRINCSGGTPTPSLWQQIDRVVTFHGVITLLTVTTTGNDVAVTLDLPPLQTLGFSNVRQCKGVASFINDSNSLKEAGYVVSSSNVVPQISLVVESTTASSGAVGCQFFYSFAYEIQGPLL